MLDSGQTFSFPELIPGLGLNILQFPPQHGDWLCLLSNAQSQKMDSVGSPLHRFRDRNTMGEIRNARSPSPCPIRMGASTDWSQNKPSPTLFNRNKCVGCIWCSQTVFLQSSSPCTPGTQLPLPAPPFHPPILPGGLRASSNCNLPLSPIYTWSHWM